jgi:hypothetical protein
MVRSVRNTFARFVVFTFATEPAYHARGGILGGISGATICTFRPCRAGWPD